MTVADTLRRHTPTFVKKLLLRLYWLGYDMRDYSIELVGLLPSHIARLFIYRRLFGVKLGKKSSIHRNCRFYRPTGVNIGNHSVINRNVLLDGRSGLRIGNNVSISEDSMLLSLEHDPNSRKFSNRGGEVIVDDYVFVGTRAIILPAITIGRGAVVAAGAVVTHDVEPYTIVGGVPARVIGQRTRDLDYQLDYRKFLG